MTRFIEVTDNWNSYKLIPVDDIKSVGPARDPKETIIRHKSGRYTIAKGPYHGHAAAVKGGFRCLVRGAS